MYSCQQKRQIMLCFTYLERHNQAGINVYLAIILINILKIDKGIRSCIWIKNKAFQKLSNVLGIGNFPYYSYVISYRLFGSRCRTISSNMKTKKRFYRRKSRISSKEHMKGEYFCKLSKQEWEREKRKENLEMLILTGRYWSHEKQWESESKQLDGFE